jgi:hypothetical protein
LQRGGSAAPFSFATKRLGQRDFLVTWFRSLVFGT